MGDLARHLRRAREAGAVVHRHQVVVDGFGDADEALARRVRPRPFGERVHGVHGVVAADVEHGFDVVRVHDVCKATEIGLVVAFELVAAGAEGGRGRLLEQVKLAAGQVREVVQPVVQHAFDTVDAAPHAVVQRVQLVRADDAGQAGVDDGGRAAGLCNKAGAHENGAPVLSVPFRRMRPSMMLRAACGKLFLAFSIGVS